MASSWRGCQFVSVSGPKPNPPSLPGKHRELRRGHAIAPGASCPARRREPKAFFPGVVWRPLSLVRPRPFWQTTSCLPASAFVSSRFVVVRPPATTRPRPEDSRWPPASSATDPASLSVRSVTAPAMTRPTGSVRSAGAGGCSGASPATAQGKGTRRAGGMARSGNCVMLSGVRKKGGSSPPSSPPAACRLPPRVIPDPYAHSSETWR
jgi:hypothetical protein